MKLRDADASLPEKGPCLVFAVLMQNATALKLADADLRTLGTGPQPRDGLRDCDLVVAAFEQRESVLQLIDESLKRGTEVAPASDHPHLHERSAFRNASAIL